jgi:hypothetical protein
LEAAAVAGCGPEIKNKGKEVPVITLSSLEDALAFLDRYAGEKEHEAPSVQFSGELAEITIDVDGPRYHASIPSELARGLWEYQEALYRAVTLVLYEVEDIRRLTEEQRKDFELVFAVSEGSTDLVAKLKDFLAKLGEGFLTMESKHKGYTLVAIAVVLSTGWGAVTVLEAHASSKKEEIKAQAQIALEQEKTRQFEVLARVSQQSAVAAFSKAAEEGAKAIVRRAPDATQVRIGRTNIDRSDIEEVNRRSAIEKATAEIVQENFSVIATSSRDASATRYWLARKDGSEFSVVLSHEDFEVAALEKIWAAARDRKPIALEVNLTMSRGTIRAAQIIKVL